MSDTETKLNIGGTRIDKIKFQDGEIISIDNEMVETLKLHNMLFVNEQSKDEQEKEEQEKEPNRYVTRDGKQNFSYMKIKGDGEINVLKAGKCACGKQYVKLETNVCDEQLGNFVGNTVKEYQEQIDRIENKLWDNYGINASFRNANINYIELNRTFELNHPFEEYKRPIKLILDEMPKMKYLKEFGDTKIIDTFFVEKVEDIGTFSKCNKRGVKKDKDGAIKYSNNTASLKIVTFYNKGKQIQGVIYLDGDYMRVEIKLIGLKNVHKAFHTNNLYELTDDVINNYFAEQIETLMVNPLKKWKAKRKTFLKRLLKEERDRDISNWQVNVLRVLNTHESLYNKPCLLDVSELDSIVDGLADIKRKQRVKDNFRKQAAKYEHIFCNGDDIKLQEIIDKLLVKESATIMAEVDHDNGECVADVKIA